MHLMLNSDRAKEEISTSTHWILRLVGHRLRKVRSKKPS